MKKLILFILTLAISSLVLAQHADYAGTWAGAMNRPAGLAGIEFTLTRDGDVWKGTMKMRVPNGDLTPTVSDVQIAGADISFTATQANGNVLKFKARFDGDKLNGTFETSRDGNKVAEGTIALTRGGQMAAVQQAPAGGGQVADPDFNARVAHPAYSKNGPKVLFDEAHNNFHTAGGRYKPFADLITSDGFQITPNKEKFSAQTLKGFDILVISNALGSPAMNAPEAANPAFTDVESDAVRDWVKAGGSLLLIADHAPMGSANQILADRFGVNMSKRFTADEQNFDKDSQNPGFIIYTRDSGRLADHPITRGRNEAERVNKIIAFTGQSLKGPPDSFAFMKLADSAIDAMPNTAPISAAGRAQGLVLNSGKGRVVILGEAAMLSAQIAGANQMKFGMNRPGIDNRQLALNIMHWLSGLLK